MKLVKPILHTTLIAIYVEDLGIKEFSRKCGRSPSTVHAQLDSIDRFIANWLQDDAVIRAKKSLGEN
jgi:DNA-directed RNA polymerase specialized sigma24 family protein